MKKYNLYLDDYRNPNQSFRVTKQNVYINLDWIVVRNYDEFKNAIISNGIPDIVSFDHDLSDEHYDPDNHGSETFNIDYDSYEHKTGFDCAKWLIEYCVDNIKELPRSIMIHSMNVYGSMNIKSLFETYYKVHGITNREKINDVRYSNVLGLIYSGYEED